MAQGAFGGRDRAGTSALPGHASSWVLALGASTALAGVLVLVWPGATLKVIAVVFGIFLLVSGVFRLVSASRKDETGGVSRALVALVGVFSIVVGLLCLRNPFQTLAVLTLLLGLFWVISGGVEVVHALARRELTGRGWAIGMGGLTLAAGILVLVYPSATLLVLVWLVGLHLLLSGGIAIALGVHLHREERTVVPAPEPRHA
jgi:uncharacterized membrane protein HdeD (DUF308 family)